MVGDHWRKEELCKHCNGGESGEGGAQMLICDCCLDVGAHMDCHEQATGNKITAEQIERPSFQWFCSEVCCCFKCLP